MARIVGGHLIQASVRAWAVLVGIQIVDACAAVKAQAPLARPADLVHRRVDPNGFPINPFWSIQETQTGSRPSITALCSLHRPHSPGQVSDYFGTPDCTSQLGQISVELAGGGLYGDLCRTAALPQPRFPGHLNWFPVTVLGQGSWLHIDPLDHDVNLLLVPDPMDGIVAPGLTSAAPQLKGLAAYKVEFDEREVFEEIANAGASTPLWQRVLSSAPERKRLLQNKYYLMTGLYGLDAQHDYHAELHPIWGFAVRLQSEQDLETWLIFARNSGNEGGCSSRTRFRLPQSQDGVMQMAFDLPIAPQLGIPQVTATFRNLFGLDAPFLAQVQAGATNRTVRLTIPFPTDNSGIQLVFGELKVSKP